MAGKDSTSEAAPAPAPQYDMAALADMISGKIDAAGAPLRAQLAPAHPAPPPLF